jgi:serine phosphatase RsbU (regulator of sigma subunit)/anti-sigma regulatory factor (Ser/Thr protein kinase)
MPGRSRDKIPPMTAAAHPLRRLFGRPTAGTVPRALPNNVASLAIQGVAVEIPETDPLFIVLQSAAGPVDVRTLELASPALQQLRDAGAALVVPLVTHGELIGTLNLGPRLSEQEYSTEDRRLLATLASQAAPAIRVAQLVQEQAAEAAERERYEQELRVAQLIQQQFLPRELPNLRHWSVDAYYGAARVVGGDFYDFIELDDGRIGIAVGDVADKGVPAALVMARTHSILRAEAPRLVDPGRVLARANELLVPEMPPQMFVTCLYGVLEPETGRFVFANAGHNLPCIRTADGIVEPRATGLPLGLLPDIAYDQVETTIGPGDEMLLFSDGLVEAHDPQGEMYGFPRLREAMAAEAGSGSGVIERLLQRLESFTGAGWDQEDDITLVTLRRSASDHGVLAAFAIPGATGGERVAMERVTEAVAGLGLDPARLERLKTAVAETVMNAIEYGSLGDASVPVGVRVEADEAAITVRVTDRAMSGPVGEVAEPDLEAKLEGRQRPRGWGLFLIRHMVDVMEVSSENGLQTVTLTLARPQPRQP